MYLGLFGSKRDIIEQFHLDKDELKNVKILYASYEYEDYSGSAFVLFEQNGELYEVNGSHCSCYGLEGQWQPEETFPEAIEKRFDVDKQLKGVLNRWKREHKEN